MKQLSNRPNYSKGKENFNFINRLTSPEPTRGVKGKSTQINSQRKMLTSQDETNLCSTRDGREATHFYMDEDESVLKYCAKCAIMLASKGFNVEKLSKVCLSQRSNQTESSLSSTKSFRKQQDKRCPIKERLGKVEELKENIELCEREIEAQLNEAETTLISSSDKYSALISQISSYFRIIEHLIEYQKNLAYNRILTERVNNEKEMRTYKLNLQEMKQTLGHIKEDLIENQDVVLTVDLQQFDSIIDNYQTTVQSVPQMIDSRPDIIQPISSIILPPVPEILDQLADSMMFVKQHNQESYQCQQGQTSFKGLRNNIARSTSEQQKQQQPSTGMKRDVSPILHLKLSSLQALQQQIEEGQQGQNEGDSQNVSQHSFSLKSAFQRDAMGLNKPQYQQKEVMLQGSFSVASSIINNECISSQEDHDDNITESYEPPKKQHRGGIDILQLPKWKRNLNKMQKSLSRYLNGDDSFMLNQTEHDDRSESLLLNQ